MNFNSHEYSLLFFFIASCLFTYFCLCRFHENFGRFEDHTNRNRTDKLANSSLNQQTNHAIISKTFDAGPLPGTQSPFQINMWKAYF